MPLSNLITPRNNLARGDQVGLELDLNLSNSKIGGYRLYSCEEGAGIECFEACQAERFC
jgi:hypothetical protein